MECPVKTRHSTYFLMRALLRGHYSRHPQQTLLPLRKGRAMYNPSFYRVVHIWREKNTIKMAISQKMFTIISQYEGGNQEGKQRGHSRWGKSVFGTCFIGVKPSLILSHFCFIVFCVADQNVWVGELTAQNALQTLSQPI